MSNADRYVCQGSAVPRIYPGTLPGIQNALSDAARAGEADPEAVMRVSAVYGTERVLIRVFKGGVCTWQPDSSDAFT